MHRRRARAKKKENEAKAMVVLVVVVAGRNTRDGGGKGVRQGGREEDRE